MKRFVALLCMLCLCCLCSVAPAFAQVPSSFNGLSASQEAPPLPFASDPNIAASTTQILEYTNQMFQAYSIATGAPLWAAPIAGDAPWVGNPLATHCHGRDNDGLVAHDQSAARFVVIRRFTDPGTGKGFFCIAFTTTNDLTVPPTWNGQELDMSTVITQTNSLGHQYFMDYPKVIGTGFPTSVYVTFNVEDPDFKPDGTKSIGAGYADVATGVIAFDRANLIAGTTPRVPQTKTVPAAQPYGTTEIPYHSILASTVEGAIPPPGGEDVRMFSVQRPPADGETLTSNTINYFTYHVNWNNRAQTALSGPTPVIVPIYRLGCYILGQMFNTKCVPQPSGIAVLDSTGDRLMNRIAYMNSGTAESFLFSMTIQRDPTSVPNNPQTTIRVYQFLATPPGAIPVLANTVDINPGDNLYRFVPSVTQDICGDWGLAYTTSGPMFGQHPSFVMAWMPPGGSITPTEMIIVAGTGDRNGANNWEDYTTAIVAPSNNKTFFGVGEFHTANETGTANWKTKIGKFTVPGC